MVDVDTEIGFGNVAATVYVARAAFIAGDCVEKFESQRSRGSQKREIFKIARGVDSLGLHFPAAQRPMSGSMLLHPSFRVVGKGVEGAHGVSSRTNFRVQTPVMQVPVWH